MDAENPHDIPLYCAIHVSKPNSPGSEGFRSRSETECRWHRNAQEVNRRSPLWRDTAMIHDWMKLAADLERLLKLRSIPFGMKLFERREEMEAIPRIRRPKVVHTLDQVVG